MKLCQKIFTLGFANSFHVNKNFVSICKASQTSQLYINDFNEDGSGYVLHFYAYKSNKIIVNIIYNNSLRGMINFYICILN